MSSLGLPPVPSQLKSLSAYIQRADELKTQDPVIAYWCIYHAAQIGITHSGKDHAANLFLGKLLDVLERMKKDLASHDAIRDENVASAYVENFALKIFVAADNEDRAGKATRATAKRFLAAANFLEVLSVFSQGATDSVLPGENTNAEKIKYAKWKAADIARAYREGRKPTPGPASVVEETLPSVPEAPIEPIAPPTSSTPPPVISTVTPSSPPSIVRDTPPPPQLNNLSTPPSNNLLLPGGHLTDPKSPGSWSTVATPGTPGRGFDDDDFPRERSAFVSDDIDDGSPGGAHPGVGIGGISPPRSASSVETTSPDPRRARFSPSTPGDSAVTTPSVVTQGPEDDPVHVQVIVNSPNVGFPTAPPPVDQFSPGFVPTFEYELPMHPPPTQPHAPLPLSQTYTPIPPAAPNPPAQSPQHYIPSMVPDDPRRNLRSPVAPVSVELTPLVIAKTQKHCRFAISALDYDDAETARKELRAALALLGG